MKFTAKASDLAAAAALVAKILPGKVVITILGHAVVRADADDGSVTLLGHDLDRSIIVRVDAEVEEPGVCTADIRRLAKWLAAIPGKTIVKVHTNE